jgi:tetratricopeptide (TPR) repeat protein
MRNILLLICLIGLSLAPCLKADFVYWDDDLHLLKNPVIQQTSLANTLEIFRSVVNKTYIPLTILTFNIEHYFFGLNPFAYHLNNLILHLLICLLIYRLLCRMGLDKQVAFLAALLFGIHPMHVESVAWVTQRKDVLYSLFYLLSLSCYWTYLTHRRKNSYLGSIVFAVLSILAKPMALSLPLTLLVLDWYYQGRIIRQALANKVPFLLLIVPIAWITYSLNARIPFENIPESFLTWAWSATFYIKKFFTPFVLLPLYSLPQPVSIFNPSYASSVLMLIALPFVLWICRRDRLLFFAITFYTLSTFFLWRYDNTVDITIVADRFMYLPSLGFCVWLAHMAVGNYKNQRIFILTIGLIALLMIKTFLQCGIWQNDLTLWNHQIKHDTTSAHAFNSRGVALSKLGKTDDALKDLNRAIELRPAHALSHYNRGHIYARIGRSNEALNDYSRSITLDPEHINSLIERGVLYSKLGELNRALEDLNNAEKLAPNNTGVFNNRGIIYKKLGQWENSLNDYNRALQLNPRSASTYVNRARVWQELGNQDEADKDLAEAQKLGIKLDAALFTQP